MSDLSISVRKQIQLNAVDSDAHKFWPLDLERESGNRWH